MSDGLEKYREKADRELIDIVRNLIPALVVLLERIEIKPEEPEKPEKPTKRCNYCMGSGIIALTRMKCANCTDGRVPA